MWCSRASRDRHEVKDKVVLLLQWILGIILPPTILNQLNSPTPVPIAGRSLTYSACIPSTATIRSAVFTPDESWSMVRFCFFKDEHP
jgi:hypothetical protein